MVAKRALWILISIALFPLVTAAQGQDVTKIDQELGRSGQKTGDVYRVGFPRTVYVRYNQFNGDPVTGKNVRAVNFGYFLPIGRLSRLSIDYQYKNRPSFEDDAINGRFQITWQIFLGKPSEEASGKMDNASTKSGISTEK